MGIRQKILLLFTAVYIVTLLLYVFIAMEFINKSYSMAHLTHFKRNIDSSIELYQKAAASGILSEAEKQEYQRTFLQSLREYQQKEVFKLDIMGKLIGNLAWVTLPFFAISLLVIFLIINSAVNPLRALAAVMEGYPGTKAQSVLEPTGPKEVKLLIRTFGGMIGKIEAYEQQIKSQEKVSGWFEMSRAIVHEIGNYMVPVEKALKTTRAKTGGGEEIEQVQRSFDRIRESIAELRNFYKSGQRRQPVRFDIMSELRFLCQGFNVTLENRTGMETVHLFSDKLEFSQLIINLLKNAIEAVPPERQPAVRLILSGDGGNAVIEIIDNGSGIPAGELEKIFEPGHSTKKKGLGLGLPTVKRIVAFNAWDLRIHSTISSGTTMTVAMPLASGSESNTKPAVETA